MIRLLTISCVALIILSCNDAEDKRSDADTLVIKDSTDNQLPGLGGCYMRVLQRDTLAASLTQQGDVVKGRLSFDNYQKDGSTGSVTGVIDGDILKMIYRFHSEGMNSVSEVYFKITGDGLIHGFGDIQVIGDSAYFSDPSNIRYPEADLLRKLPCGDLPDKYKSETTQR